MTRMGVPGGIGREVSIKTDTVKTPLQSTTRVNTAVRCPLYTSLAQDTHRLAQTQRQRHTHTDRPHTQTHRRIDTHKTHTHRLAQTQRQRHTQIDHTHRLITHTHTHTHTHTTHTDHRHTRIDTHNTHKTHTHRLAQTQTEITD